MSQNRKRHLCACRCVNPSIKHNKHSRAASHIDICRSCMAINGYKMLPLFQLCSAPCTLLHTYSLQLCICVNCLSLLSMSYMKPLNPTKPYCKILQDCHLDFNTEFQTKMLLSYAEHTYSDFYIVIYVYI